MSTEKAELALLYSTAQEIEDFKEANGRYPASLDELKPPYHVNTDSQGRLPYYHLAENGKIFELALLGSDGKQGTLDDVKFDPSKMADNTLPMYGGPDHVKTPYQLEADEKFIQAVAQKGESREKASQAVAAGGWAFFNKGDLSTAMKRFNQAWLLDPNNPEIYKGFAAILKKQGKMDEAQKIERMIKK
jgi:tetratricopeptide (TPR) repeat protein